MARERERNKRNEDYDELIHLAYSVLSTRERKIVRVPDEMRNKMSERRAIKWATVRRTLIAAEKAKEKWM